MHVIEYLTDDQSEALRDNVEPSATAGDSEDEFGAMFLYKVERETLFHGVAVPAGVHVRQVTGNYVTSYTLGCSWFARCENAAIDTLPHPVLHIVAVCERCRAWALG